MMKKMGILVLVMLLLCNLAFADSVRHENIPRANNQIKLFELPLEQICMYGMHDIEYHYGEKAIYVITPHGDCENPRHNNQYVFDMEGNEIVDPQYPIATDATLRLFIEFDGEDAYSLEYDSNYDTRVDDGTSATRVYDLNKNEDLGSIGRCIDRGGFQISGNHVAYHTEIEYTDIDREETPNFYIGTLDPLTTTGGSVGVFSETGRVVAFDFNPSGTELIYASYACEGPDAGIIIRSVETVTGGIIEEFIIPDSEFESDKGLWNAAWSLYATRDCIVVLSRFEELGKGRIQRFTYEGGLIDQVETNFSVTRMTEGPDGSTLYLEKRFDDDGCFASLDVVQVTWSPIKAESTGRPKSIISERTVGGQTIAGFRDDGFGLLQVEDPETGVNSYRAPLKSEELKVKLRIPFADLQGKLNAGAENLLVEYQNQQIQIPMSAFDCAELLSGMPCQDDATIEIQLEADEEGSVTVTIQLFVVEQVNEMTRVVHRKTIQY